MHQPTPGVERAVVAAQAWAERLGSGSVRLAHFVLGLLDEEEGRAAVLLERVGTSVTRVREQLPTVDSAIAPALTALYNAARDWSLAYRHDPEVLTDAFLLAVLNADDSFRATATALGFAPARLELMLTEMPAPTAPEELPSAEFSLPNATAEMDTARILDANLNRAREAARVLEDYCRFALDDRFLTQEVKELRHGLAALAQSLPPGLLLSARETLRDVGTTTTAGGEYDRDSPAHVAAVNLKRLQESLRSLEEFGKLFAPQFGRDTESLRYRAYTFERALTLGAASRERLAHVSLYVLLTRARCVAALDWTIREAARGGAGVFQLREKTLPDRELIALARDVRRWTREAGVLLVVNDRPDIARLAEADGVHLGQDDLSVKDARRIAGPEMLVGVSTHSLAQLRQAVLDGADYVGIGPTFPSPTKPFDHFPGLDFIRAASAETSLPAFALGGITPANAAEVAAAGARRVAVSSAICAANDPQQAARMLVAALER